ncbi:sugar ABC transporter permease [Sinorhizobium meliloti WSM1022]|jgi:multiple sugar transport system permease protein|uniref:Polyol ABC transporter, permease component n=9 Tax=Sinorhizobium TaxID=28105 RepID=Q92NG6_RHIME|nr:MULTISPECIES: sugar ABC transporter permease [Sinorhizobium]PST24790.1 sugar ABC transporter permease [Mesorhizobium loti]TWA90989.1 carbohydrate ABC transporter membrane protein 1 (CUT1 family) [Ensifer sp. SEMIA 134]TWB27486.1 carbohydrate ABC transporter membrane protein 1 (CUT1 family) [Ensifer sp. SEMIA 135]AEG04968.1 ABC-type transporter, integral membrane subunit [Sinorhizobium meliloti BL225C]AEG53939.1 ABC-type transporter, integral membrane subunit [Sinorhizobium meliloti AK83]
MASVTHSSPRGSRFRISKRALPYVLSLPALLVCIGILIPFFTAVIYSFQRYRLSQPWARQFNWGENYLNFFTDPGFWNTLKISLLYAGVTVTLELLLGLGIALLLQRRSTVNNFISIMLLLPLMTAPALAALMWKLMTNPGFGILSYLASLVGLENFRWASSPDTALLTVVLVDIWVYTPFIMILLLAGLRSLPTQPFEAAALDGVPRSFVFFRITLPMLTPYILTATLFRLLDSIQQFDIIYAMTQGGPGDTLTVFQVEAYLNFFQSTNVGRSAALLIILWAITYALSNIFIKNWLRLRERARGEA